MGLCGGQARCAGQGGPLRKAGDCPGGGHVTGGAAQRPRAELRSLEGGQALPPPVFSSHAVRPRPLPRRIPLDQSNHSGRACALGGRADRKEGERMRPERLSAQVSGAWAGLALGSGSSPDPAEERGGPGSGEGRGWPVCVRGGRGIRARGTAGPPRGPSRASRAARGGAKAWTAL